MPTELSRDFNCSLTFHYDGEFLLKQAQEGVKTANAADKFHFAAFKTSCTRLTPVFMISKSSFHQLSGLTVQSPCLDHYLSSHLQSDELVFLAKIWDDLAVERSYFSKRKPLLRCVWTCDSHFHCT